MPDLEKAKSIVAAFQKLVDTTPIESTHVRLSPDAWTLIEIIGHLIDSASNNHQRFVRLQFGDLDNFPAYEAESWVTAQHYDKCEFSELADLWKQYNAFLIHLAENAPESALANKWKKPEGNLTFGFLIDDYFDHMKLHVEHYQERLKAALKRSAG